MRIGEIFLTNGVQKLMYSNANFCDLHEALRLFQRNDWGELSEIDKDYQNEILLSNDEYYGYMGVYLIDKTKVWLMHSRENKRDITTVLLPSEY